MLPIPRPHIRNNVKPSKLINQKLINPPVFSPHLIKELIASQSNKSAPGADRIPYFCFKKLPDVNITHITALFNAVMRQGHFPTPFSKSGQTLNDRTSYRPINLLPTLSNVLEHLIKDHCNNIIEDNKILPDVRIQIKSLYGLATHENT